MILGRHPLGRVPLGYDAPPTGGGGGQPNGRWRAVGQEGTVRLPNNITDLSPDLNEAGFSIFIDIPESLNVSLAGMSMVFIRPSGTSFRTVELVAGDNNIAGYLIPQRTFIYHVTRAGELDEPGLWSVYLKRRGIAVSNVCRFAVRGTVS